jgi:hemerythrin
MAEDKSFIWKNDYAVGIEKLDKQHKEIITLITDLSRLSVVDDIESYETFKIMFSSAVEYLVHHFSEEEEYMEKNNYRNFSEHKKEHEKMKIKMRLMLVNFGKEEKMTIKSVSKYLIEWYKEHITVFDKEMGVYFKK